METQSKGPRPGKIVAAEPALQPRRRFLGTLVAAAGGALTASSPARPARAGSAHLHLQDCRIAGSHHYDCLRLLPRLRSGDALRLQWQPQNPHDARAIEVFWRDHKLGYSPRLDNAAAASLADRAHALHAEIIGIDDPDDEWEPVRLRVWVATK
jgi:hypothetical protein